MTEYKKLTTVIDDIHSHQLRFKEWASAQNGATNESVEQSPSVEVKYSLMKTILSLIRETFPRMLKLVLKGREKDPNRQIYNERMTGRINELYSSYCKEILCLWYYWTNECPEGSLSYHYIEDEEAFATYTNKIRSRLQEIKSFSAVSVNRMMTSTSCNSVEGSARCTNNFEPTPDIQHQETDIATSPLSFNESVKILESVLIADHNEAVEKYLSLEDEIPLFVRLTNAYFTFIQKLSEREDWERQTAANMNEIITLEASLRQLIIANEHEKQRKLIQNHRDDRLKLLLLIESKKVEKQKKEMSRRITENELLMHKSREWSHCSELEGPSKRHNWTKAFSRLVSCISLSNDPLPLPFNTKKLNNQVPLEVSHPITEPETRLMTLLSPDSTLIRIEPVLPMMYKKWLHHLLTLVMHIQKAPDDINIRTLRANHQAFMEHFSHPSFVLYIWSSNEIDTDLECLGDVKKNGTSESISVEPDNCATEIQEEKKVGFKEKTVCNNSPMCACKFIFHYTELVLYTIGYRVKYDSWEDSFKKRSTGRVADVSSPPSATFSSNVIKEDGEASLESNRKCCLSGSTFVNFADLPFPVSQSTLCTSTSTSIRKCDVGTAAGDQCAALPDFYFPCGRRASAHQYRAVGFEPYGERLYQLMEPNPEEDPDAWMLWFDTLNELHSALLNLLSE